MTVVVETMSARGPLTPLVPALPNPLDQPLPLHLHVGATRRRSGPKWTASPRFGPGRRTRRRELLEAVDAYLRKIDVTGR